MDVTVNKTPENAFSQLFQCGSLNRIVLVNSPIRTRLCNSQVRNSHNLQISCLELNSLLISFRSTRGYHIGLHHCPPHAVHKVMVHVSLFVSVVVVTIVHMAGIEFRRRASVGTGLGV